MIGSDITFKSISEKQFVIKYLKSNQLFNQSIDGKFNLFFWLNYVLIFQTGFQLLIVLFVCLSESGAFAQLLPKPWISCPSTTGAAAIASSAVGGFRSGRKSANAGQSEPNANTSGGAAAAQFAFGSSAAIHWAATHSASTIGRSVPWLRGGPRPL